MSTGHPISEEVADFLYRKAKEMVRKRKDSLKLKSPVCEGRLTTEWKYSAMGPLSGLTFKAEIEFDVHKTTLTFIVRTRDFDEEESEGGWGMATDDELERMATFEAMHERPQKHQLN